VTSAYSEQVAKSECETELSRVIHRLEVLPVRHHDIAYALTLTAAQTLRNWTVDVDPTGPRELPQLEPRMAGAQLSVVARDFLTVGSPSHVTEATALLTELRRSLP
jgi:membrane protein required for beta-lactamase induction